MRINTNVSALNAWRNLTVTDMALTKSLERLSSGLRINRAADDAAGLAISEKMRAQIRGLNQAARNAQDGISLLQTAEGALNEVHAILQRMRELAVYASNDTMTAQDRSAVQDELTQLTKELDRIANTTEFNTQKLLDGTFVGKQLQIGANAGQNVQFTIADMSAGKLGAVWDDGASIDLAGLTVSNEVAINGVSVSFATNSTIDELVQAINAKADQTGVQAEKLEQTIFDAGAFTSATVTTSLTLNGVQIVVTTADNVNTFIDKVNAVSGQTGVVASKTDTGNVILTNPTAGNIAVQEGAGDFLANVNSTGATYAVGLRLYADLGSTITLSGAVSSIGLASFTPSAHTVLQNVQVNSPNAAQEAIKTLDFALRRVSEERSTLGALQNRLEHTVANLSVASENLTAAESRIRDVDMAQEMMAFVKNQILLQSGTAMLAQANTKPQSVLQLLS